MVTVTRVTANSQKLQGATQEEESNSSGGETTDMGGDSEIQGDSEQIRGRKKGSKVPPTPELPKFAKPGLPRYNSAPPCKDNKSGSKPITPAIKYYQLLPGSPDGVVPPVEMKANVYEHCVGQFSNIMAGFAQTPPMVIQMTKDWCGLQGAVTEWNTKGSSGGNEVGMPHWTFRTCNNMANLLSFALHPQLTDSAKLTAGLSAPQVCKSLFLSMGSVHRVSSLVSTAWEVSARGLGQLGLTTAVDEEAAKKLMQQAQDYAAAAAGQLRQQKQMFDNLNGVKMDASAFANEMV